MENFGPLVLDHQWLIGIALGKLPNTLNEKGGRS